MGGYFYKNSYSTWTSYTYIYSSDWETIDEIHKVSFEPTKNYVILRLDDIAYFGGYGQNIEYTNLIDGGEYRFQRFLVLKDPMDTTRQAWDYDKYRSDVWIEIVEDYNKAPLSVRFKEVNREIVYFLKQY